MRFKTQPERPLVLVGLIIAVTLHRTSARPLVLSRAANISHATAVDMLHRHDEECSGWVTGTLETYNNAALLQKGIRAQRGGFTSQYRQDKVVWSHHFINRSGPQYHYLDLAANHYKQLSNTYFFDRCLGWSGTCVEPNPIYHEALRKNRSCRVVPHCVSNSTEEIDFMAGDEHVGLFGSIDGQSPLAEVLRSKAKMIRMRCLQLQTILAEGNIDHIDFMSLDVEGHEEFVLKSIDFSKVRIDYILCESHCFNVLPLLGYVPVLTFSVRERLWMCVATVCGADRDLDVSFAMSSEQRHPHQPARLQPLVDGDNDVALPKVLTSRPSLRSSAAQNRASSIISDLLEMKSKGELTAYQFATIATAIATGT